ncbi:hypothetical protein O722_00642, partial [Staphylococcus aureus M0725]
LLNANTTHEQEAHHYVMCLLLCNQRGVRDDQA